MRKHLHISSSNLSGKHKKRHRLEKTGGDMPHEGMMNVSRVLNPNKQPDKENKHHSITL